MGTNHAPRVSLTNPEPVVKDKRDKSPCEKNFKFPLINGEEKSFESLGCCVSEHSYWKSARTCLTLSSCLWVRSRLRIVKFMSVRMMFPCGVRSLVRFVRSTLRFYLFISRSELNRFIFISGSLRIVTFTSVGASFRVRRIMLILGPVLTFPPPPLPSPLSSFPQATLTVVPN